MASDLAVFWLAFVICRWTAAVPQRFARLVAKDRRDAVAAALRRCDALTARVGALSVENESLRADLLSARVERAAALVEARLARARAARLVVADLDAADEDDTAPVERDTVRSPPPEDGPGEPEEPPAEDATLVIGRYKLPKLAPLAVARFPHGLRHEPARDEDQTPPDGGS
jgi:hypothetical protein